MKYLVCTTMAACSFMATYAQKDSTLIFGNIGGARSANQDVYSQSTQKSSLVSCQLGIGYSVSRRTTLGLQAYYKRFLSSDDANSSKIIQEGMGLAAFGRYTQGVGSIFFVYLHVYAGYDQSVRRNYDSPGTYTTDKGNGLSAGLYPAIGAQVYKGWALNFNIGGIQYGWLNSAANKQNNLTYNFGQSATFGISKTFGNRIAKPAPGE